MLRPYAFFALALLTFIGCTETAEHRVNPDDPTGEVTITADELEPMVNFVMETRRLLVADFVRVEVSQQFFEKQMGYTRDPQTVLREPVQVESDGTRVVVLRNILQQTTNMDPDKLPRVYFGSGGLEIRAYREIRIYLRPPNDKERPLFLRVDARSDPGDARMWVSGRLQYEKPSLQLDSSLIWSEDKERYLHKGSVG